MSWRAQNRSKDAKTPNVGPAMSRKLKPALSGIQRYTQSSILRNTETASTRQSVSYLNALPRCDPSMPGRRYCRIQGESPEIIAFPCSGPS
jgi:hypothetical protein